MVFRKDGSYILDDRTGESMQVDKNCFVHIANIGEALRFFFLRQGNVEVLRVMDGRPEAAGDAQPEVVKDDQGETSSDTRRNEFRSRDGYEATGCGSDA